MLVKKKKKKALRKRMGMIFSLGPLDDLKTALL